MTLRHFDDRNIYPMLNLSVDYNLSPASNATQLISTAIHNFTK